MRRAAELIAIVLGSTILALCVGFILAGVNASGVITMELTHTFFWIALALASLGAFLGLMLMAQPLKYSITGGLLTLIFVGGGLLGLDGWLHKKKTEQDAANHPPAPIDKLNYIPPKPSVPIVKTPRQWLSAPIKQAVVPTQDNSVHVEGGSTIKQDSGSGNGNCNPNIVGGSNTVNCPQPLPQVDVIAKNSDNIHVEGNLINAPVQLTFDHASNSWFMNNAILRAPPPRPPATGVAFEATKVGTKALQQVTFSPPVVGVMKSIEIQGRDSAEFGIKSDCIGKTINPHDLCIVSVSFNPLAAGDKTAKIVVVFNSSTGKDGPPELPITGVAAN